MAEGHDEDAWQHTSHLMANQISVFSKNAVKPSDVNPYLKAKQRRTERKAAKDMPKIGARELGKMMGARPAKKRKPETP